MRRRAAIWLSLLMALVLLAGPFIVTLHHHEAHNHHSDCPVCQLATTLASIELPPSPQIEIDEFYQLLDVPLRAEIVPNPAIQRPRPRSPPYLLVTEA